MRKHAAPDKGLAESKTHKRPVAKQVPKCDQLSGSDSGNAVRTVTKIKTPDPGQHDKHS
ncbi:hypothetical protein ACRV5I_12540 [Bacillus halotolerans]|uniref:hypothetical protein n=1 Tax=Bacillus halotolerans TaxID=260554 RepID=UPI003EB71CF6